MLAFRPVISVCLVSLAAICVGAVYAPHHRDQEMKGPRAAADTGRQTTGTVYYTQVGHPAKVTFEIDESGPFWVMSISDPRDVGQQSGNLATRSVAGLCSTPAFLRIIDRGLNDFHIHMPKARLGEMDVQMTVPRELWLEIVDGLRRKLSNMPGRMATIHDVRNDDLSSPPDETSDAVVHVVHRSRTTALIVALLRRHGLKVTEYGPKTVNFNEAFVGRKWSDIANSPNSGIDFGGLPLTIEFDVE
ncbi:MAG: hypothetical protein ACLQVD_13605 [Capsulimonadaceae bacterium]